MSGRPIHLLSAWVLVSAGAAAAEANLRFYEACAAGRAEEVEKHLQTQPHLANQPRKDNGRYPLELAVENRRLQVVDALLDAGADLNRSMQEGYALEIAVTLGDFELVKLLTDRGAPLYIEPSNWHNPPLYQAVKRGDRSIVQHLLDSGAGVNAPAFANKTALQAAAEKDDLPMVKLLLKQGGQPDARDNFKTTPLHEAATAARLEIVELLLAAGGDPNAHDREGFTPILAAAKAGRHDVTLLLGRHGGLHDVFVDTYLRDLGNVMAALDEDASLMRKSLMDGSSLLHVAAQTRQPALAEGLLQHGANLDARDRNGAAPLHTAAATGDARMVALLLQRHADPHARDNEGRTPIDQAASTKARQLLEKAIDEDSN
ncbi:MAG: ankyrin repeat domain-containing protein [Planctomycetes bacterium]|nr:ankyrin repeat domain-containing protein [Planctomycetota bacterium]